MHKYRLNSLNISGFRAYLSPKAFDFSKSHSLAVYAPNGHGKSSLIDALEFLFSENGTLDRLGLKSVNNQAGPEALSHNLASERQVSSEVTANFESAGTKVICHRKVTKGKSSISDQIKQIRGMFLVNPIIRGYSLRNFVEKSTPEERYGEVAAWLQLDPLVNIQKNIRALRTQLKAELENKSKINLIATRLGKEIGKSPSDVNEVSILQFINDSLLKPLDLELVMKNLARTDSAYLGVKHQSPEFQFDAELSSFEKQKTFAELLYKLCTEESEGGKPTGAIQEFVASTEVLIAAVQDEEAEKAKSANAIFEQIWQSAKKAIEGLSEESWFSSCPLCKTSLHDTQVETVEGMAAHVAIELAHITEYAEVKRKLVSAQASAESQKAKLKKALSDFKVVITADVKSSLQQEIDSFQSNLDSWATGAAPSHENLIKETISFTENLTDAICARLSSNQGSPYPSILSKMDSLIDSYDELAVELRIKTKLEFLNDELANSAVSISTKIRDKMELLIGTLQDPMMQLYRLVQGDASRSVRLELPKEEDTNQQRLCLVTDFAENRQGVQPSGYLSDSQIHTLALCFRLAAIKKFNGAAPIIALDDIVTSYDANHRKNVSNMLINELQDFQIIITTHDERFFKYLVEQSGNQGWCFTRIMRNDLDYGPRFADHRVTDQMISDKWLQGLSAANEIRQAEEEWLLTVCRDFGVEVRIRDLEKAFSYDRGELAIALATFLKSSGIGIPVTASHGSRFLNSLQRGEIENFGSHFQENPYATGSIGDEKARWDEFVVFREMFKCQACLRKKFKRPVTLKKPICSHDKCETQFSFASS